MQDIPYNCGKITVVDAGYKGWGVQAIDDIAKDEVIEKCAFVAFPRITNFADAFYNFLNGQNFLSEKEKYAENLRQNLKFHHPQNHYFKWAAPTPLNGEQISYTCIVLGNGSLYNSSNAFNNAGWIVEPKLFSFKAVRDINKGEMIETFYGYFLGEAGQIFNCDQVFNLALETSKDNISKCYAIRHSSVEDFQKSQQNQAHQRIAQLLSLATDGLRIHKIVGLAPNGEEKFGLDIGSDAPLSVIFSKLQEFKTNQFPLVKIIFEYTDRNNSQITQEPIIFKK